MLPSSMAESVGFFLAPGALVALQPGRGTMNWGLEGPRQPVQCSSGSGRCRSAKRTVAGRNVHCVDRCCLASFAQCCTVEMVYTVAGEPQPRTDMRLDLYVQLDRESQSWQCKFKV